ncbi:MAG TPA: hypothetical protein VN922_09730, partial [Bacteroidia bacterium]|nr:hypothetical protein [Bacteroidia bacterium]
KTWDYIETDNPFFWKENEHLIQQAFKVDTDEPDTIKFCFSRAQALGVKPSQIKQTAEQIGFDINLILRK